MYNSGQALEAQLALLAFWLSEESIPECQHLRSQMLASSSGAAPSLKDYRAMMVDTLRKADTYFVTTEIATILSYSLDTLPDLPLNETLPPAPVGFVLIDHPARVVYPTLQSEGYMPFAAFSWHRQFNANKVTGITSEEIQCKFFGEGYGRSLHVLSEVHWPLTDSWNKSWSPVGSINSELHERMLNMRGFVTAFFAFIVQRIATTEMEPVPRSTLRRIQKSWHCPDESIVRVIQLRRKESQQRCGDNIVPIDWSCRWLVRGHWRHQFYPSAQARKLRWIEAYVKGPDDKPLKRVPLDIFAVCR